MHMVDETSSSPIKLFYSYSHRDEMFRVQLEKHFSLLHRQGVINDWSDRKITGGNDWVKAIDSHLADADIVLLLVSADFIASEYCYDIELTRAMERHERGEARVIPVILRPCDWQAAPFGNLQALPVEGKALTLWTNQDEGLADIVRGIRAVCRELTMARQQVVKLTITKEETSPDLSSDSSKQQAESNTTRDLDQRYSNLFQISSLILPYIVLVGAWEEDSNEYGMGEVVSITDTVPAYHLPQEFRSNPVPPSYFSDFKCRLEHYDCTILQPGLSRLTFTFSKIEYLDFLLSGQYLDCPLPDDPNVTFRNKYAPRLDFSDFSQSRLTNISGVGLFLITRDEKIIVSRHSSNVQVYSDVWTYSASGSMDWSEDVHPFVEAAREIFEEIGHRTSLDNTYLFGFGIDANNLVCQFSFFERTGLSSDVIIAKALMARDYHAEMRELAAIDFEPDAIVNAIKSRIWEPAAAAGLLTLCAKRFGYETVERTIDPAFVHTRVRKEMLAEWNYRASRPNDLAVMSARYPASRTLGESKKYIEAVFDFIGTDVDGKAVLELGAGIGRMSEVLVHKTGKLTCLDLSQAMLDRNRQRLGTHAQRVHYVQMFAQDYRPQKPYDITISSLVLIHNIDDADFRRLVDVIKASSGTIFLFEHVDVGYQVSRHTRLRSEESLLAAFPEYRLERRREYQLFNDNLIFLKLTR